MTRWPGEFPHRLASDFFARGRTINHEGTKDTENIEQEDAELAEWIAQLLLCSLCFLLFHNVFLCVVVVSNLLRVRSG